MTIFVNIAHLNGLDRQILFAKLHNGELV